MSVYVQDIFAVPLAKSLIAKKINPNHVTGVVILASLVSGLAFLKGFAILGSSLFFISLVLDSTDGRVARAQNRFSKFGAYLDDIGDKFRSIYVLTLILIGLDINTDLLVIVFSMYVTLPFVRLFIKFFNKDFIDPTVIFWHSMPGKGWLISKRIVGYFTGWERAAIACIIAPLTNFTVEIILLVVIFEQITFVFGVFFKFMNTATWR